MDGHFSNVARGRLDLVPPPSIPVLPSNIFPLPPATKSSSATSSSTLPISSSATSPTASSSSTSSQPSAISVTTISAAPNPTATGSSTSTSIFDASTSVISPSNSIVTVTQPISTQTDASISPSSTAVAATQKTFLQHKVLSGVVLGLAGLVGLVLIMMVATFAIRRRKKKRFIDEALSFNPVNMGERDDLDTIETGRRPINDRSSSSTGHTSHGNGPPISHAGAFNSGYVPPMPYTPTSIRSYSFAQQSNSSSGALRNAHQPYTHRYGRAGDPVHANTSQAGAPEREISWPSQSSSSGELQFAAVTPPQLSGARE